MALSKHRKRSLDYGKSFFLFFFFLFSFPRKEEIIKLLKLWKENCMRKKENKIMKGNKRGYWGGVGGCLSGLHCLGLWVLP